MLTKYLAEAEAIGKEHARNAATWVTDGNESDESRRRKLAMIEEGDPEVFDCLPRYPDLSGEFADNPTPQSLAADITGCTPAGWLTDAIADAYEEAVADTFESACEEELRRWVGATVKPRPGGLTY